MRPTQRMVRRQRLIHSVDIYVTNFGIVEKVSAARVVIDALSVEKRTKVICDNIDSDEWHHTSPMGAIYDRSSN
jgi:hypothetical protein